MSQNNTNYNSSGAYASDSDLYRVENAMGGMYDTAFLDQVSRTGGRVDTSVQYATSSDLYGNQYKSTTINTIDRTGYITDIDPRAAFRDKNGKISKRFFRAQDLYIVPASRRGTSDQTFYNSINSSYTGAVKHNASIGKPIRLPNLPSTRGMGRSLSGEVTSGYIQCVTVGHKIANNGQVFLASSPQNIQDSMSSEIASSSAVGSSQSFEIFSSVGSRTVTFSFDVYADYLPYPYNNVKDYCLALKQMNYPTYSGLQVNAPDVIFTYGGIRIRGIPQISFTYYNTIKQGYIDKATVSVQITETEEIKDGTARI